MPTTPLPNDTTTMAQHHIFALYHNNIPPADQNNTVTIRDKDLWHRIINVLRLTVQEYIIIFNDAYSYTLQLDEKTASHKHTISGTIITQEIVTPSQPHITLIPGLLKREAFESVVYYAAQMGATTIQPIITQKTQRTWRQDKDYQRLTQIMIAACEQSKSFYIPTLKQPINIMDLEATIQNIPTLLFDDVGYSFFAATQKLYYKKAHHLALIFGPEGGFTPEEITYLQKYNPMPCALTPSILRAQEAVAVGLGAVKSLLRP